MVATKKLSLKKNFGPMLGDLNLDDLSKLTESDFTSKISPVYEAINLFKNDKLTENKSTIGFVGATWTLLVYMINQTMLLSNLF